MMGLFVVALAMDDYNDRHRLAEDLRIETCTELEAEDDEWNESDLSNLPALNLVPIIPNIGDNIPFTRMCDEGFISDKQWLGLVRRYAPRKALARHNCVLT